MGTRINLLLKYVIYILMVIHYGVENGAANPKWIEKVINLKKCWPKYKILLVCLQIMIYNLLLVSV